MAFRVGVDQWIPDDRFVALLDFFSACPGTADEVAFFTSGTHPPLPLAEIRRRAEQLAERMSRVRERGMAAGINLLATLGHHEEDLEGSLDEPWQRVMDPQGVVSRGCYCPGDDRVLDYVAQACAALAAAGPDFLWIDDDVRLMGHMPVRATCFCPGCLRRFSTRAGRDFTRQTLLTAFETGDRDERLALRTRWLDHNRATIARVLEVIERAVHEVAPDLTLGFMSGDRFYEGYDFASWATALAGPAHRPVRRRPGGGCARRAISAARGGVARPVEKCSAQLCSGVGQENRGEAAISPYRERGTRSVCSDGDVDGGPPPGLDRRVVEARRVPGVRHQLADIGEDAFPRRAAGLPAAGAA
ncbi:MAG: hypothetical protein ACKOSQ_12295 [Planctomycetaceae bacterium]